MRADATGIYAWPAGERLARDLNQLVRCAGLVVVDLGCGTGVMGRAALHAGAREVRFCDQSPAALAAVQALTPQEPRASYLRHHWGEAVPGTPPDLILGGDILYRPEGFGPLLLSISASLADTGLALLSDPRSRLENELPDLAHAAGLSWDSERAADYTLVRVRRLPEARAGAR